jgi:hypothetical protein
MSETDRISKVKEYGNIIKKECTDPYARAYCDAIGESIATYGERGAMVQLLYVFTNLSSWRGDRAREVKKEVRTFLKDGGYL